MNELLTMSAVEMAGRIRAGELSPVDAVEAHIERIEAVNPRLNAVVVPTFDAARRQAREAEATLTQVDPTTLPPFFGVPCTIKELIAVEGQPWTAGVVARRRRVAERDATQVARLRAAGAIVLGLTNISEAGLWLETVNRVYGRTNNPWDVRRMAGGSTGGEAAIIAAGGSPMGLGADIGGSIRNPCFFNGIVGHKPTGRLLPSDGHWPSADGERGRYCVTGPMGRTIADLVALMEVLSPEDDPHRAPDRGPFRRLDRLDPGEVDVYWFGSNHLAPPSREVEEALERTVRALADRGCRTHRWEPRNLARSAEMWGARLSTTGDPSVRALLGDGRPAPLLREWAAFPLGRSNHTLVALLMASLEKLADLTPARTARLVAMADDLRAELETRLGPRGVLICPVYPRSAPRHGLPLLNPLAFAYCGLFNILELPSTAVPTGRNRRGLPLGLQVVGRRFDDPLTLHVAGWIEQAFGGWHCAP